MTESKSGAAAAALSPLKQQEQAVRDRLMKHLLQQHKREDIWIHLNSSKARKLVDTQINKILHRGHGLTVERDLTCISSLLKAADQRAYQYYETAGCYVPAEAPVWRAQRQNHSAPVKTAAKVQYTKRTRGPRLTILDPKAGAEFSGAGGLPTSPNVGNQSPNTAHSPNDRVRQMIMNKPTLNDESRKRLLRKFVQSKGQYTLYKPHKAKKPAPEFDHHSDSPKCHRIGIGNAPMPQKNHSCIVFDDGPEFRRGTPQTETNAQFNEHDVRAARVKPMPPPPPCTIFHKEVEGIPATTMNESFVPLNRQYAGNASLTTKMERERTQWKIGDGNRVAADSATKTEDFAGAVSNTKASFQPHPMSAYRSVRPAFNAMTPQYDWLGVKGQVRKMLQEGVTHSQFKPYELVNVENLSVEDLKAMNLANVHLRVPRIRSMD